MRLSILEATWLAAGALLWGALPASASGQTAEVVYSFVARGGGSGLPLLEASGGRLIGVDSKGGPSADGELFILTPDGLGGFEYSTLYAFAGDVHGRTPSSGLVRGEDDLLYGTTLEGGALGGGTVFRIDENGNLETVADFTDYPLPGGGLLLASDGLFYGTTFAGGDSGTGTVYRVEAAGTITVLQSFTLFGKPVGNLVQGADGALYGTLRNFAPPPNPGNQAGSIFRLTLDGAFSIVHFFGGSDGENPLGLVLASDGNIYGTTSGGALGFGTIFRIDGSGNFTTLHEATGSEGALGYPLTEGADGKLYGSSLAPINGAFFRFDPAGTFETLAFFSPSGIEGQRVSSWLAAADGDFYASAPEGGSYGYGTVVRFDGANLESVWDFRASSGWSPKTGLVDGADGWLYGTTSIGGTFHGGTAFRLDGTGAFETLHTFTGEEGYSPGLASTPLSGDFYGTTEGSQSSFFRLDSGGSVDILHAFGGQFAPTELLLASDGNFYAVNIFGDIFRITPSGTPSVLASVSNAQPGLTEGSDGALYGVHWFGGLHNRGGVFRLTLDGALSLIYSFTPLDGQIPNGGLLQSSDGYLYGTTVLGGPFGGLGDSGTIFRVNPAGHFQTLYVFQRPEAGDGNHCHGYLIEGSDGYIYGTTRGFGGGGTVFRLDKAWNQSVVHHFDIDPTNYDFLLNARLLEAEDGRLYGTAESGGDYESGFVYRIDPSTIFPVTSISPTSGPSDGGTPVTITGQQFQVGAVASIGIEDTTNPVVGGDTELTATTPAIAPGMLHHVFVQNPDGSEGSLGRGFLADFLDAPQADIFHDAVEKVFRNGITAGCIPGYYCRHSPTARAQMAVFLLKSLLGRFYTPPPATGTVFSDVAADSFAAAWIEDLAARGITAGCGDGVFCPDGSVTRAQMAVFLLKTLLGTDYEPPPATGVFGDVPVGSFAADWIEDLYTRGITSGCSSSELLYCPTAAVTRGQMAALLVATFNLP